jgi:hypothetical protein
MSPTLFESDKPAGFRIGPGGDVEVLTEAEADAVIDRVIREAMDQAIRPMGSRQRTLH